VLHPRAVPVRHLDADEHAHHHDHEIDADRGPFLLADMLDDAAQDHVDIS
jgi:hypothetical protein